MHTGLTTPSVSVEETNETGATRRPVQSGTPRKRVILSTLALFGLVGGIAPLSSQAQSPSSAIGMTEQVTTTAEGEQLRSAIGHYSKSRSLLIAAIREFDEALKLADPSPLLDAKSWRGSLIDRAQELEKILDPQPRSTKTGVRFQPDPRLLGEAPKKK